MKIADVYAPHLAQLQRESEISERKTAATIALGHALIADLQEMEERWKREDQML